MAGMAWCWSLIFCSVAFDIYRPQAEIFVVLADGLFGTAAKKCSSRQWVKTPGDY
jgi:hypothetical protein